MKFSVVIYRRFLLKGKTAGIKLPGKEDFILWGITYRRVQELVLKLDKRLRNCRRHEWIHVRLDWPYCLFGYLITALEYVFDDFSYKNALIIILLCFATVPICYKL